MSKIFLVIDADADGRALLVGTLLRVFSDGAVTECQDAKTALRLVKGHTYDAIIFHRAIGSDPTGLIRALRREKPDAPILALSTIDRRKNLVVAGATKFLNYEEWLLVGKTVLEMISPQSNAPFIPSSFPRIAPSGLPG